MQLVTKQISGMPGFDRDDLGIITSRRFKIRAMMLPNRRSPTWDAAKSFHRRPRELLRHIIPYYDLLTPTSTVSPPVCALLPLPCKSAIARVEVLF